MVQAEERMKKDKLSEIDREIELAVANGEIPGAVIWLESAGEVYHRAYGRRVVAPGSEEMTTDTIFDVASLTKVMATTPAILQLIERGLVSLEVPVFEYIPEFLSGGVRPDVEDKDVTAEDRKLVTVRHLITHQSGLPPGIFLSEADFWGYPEGVRRAATVGLIEKPGTRFRYSDVNFILLGEIVNRVSGKKLDRFAAEHLFEPLGMTETGFLPTSSSFQRIAPTTVIEGYGLLCGQVHDPTARRMEGVAGHAGLFSTARDIAKYLRIYLGEQNEGGETILKSESMRQATTNQLPETWSSERGLGWDIGSTFSYQRGEKFPKAGFGHTGWTGTSIWVDPQSKTFVILLSNRNHPTEAGVVKALRTKVGTLAAEAVGYTDLIPLTVNATEPGIEYDRQSGAAGDPEPVFSGIDVLERDGFKALAGMKIGLITNQTGVNRQRRSTIDLLASAPGVELKALFSPEHGIRGVIEADSIDDETDSATGLPIYSLYKAENRKPQKAQMKGLDALVFDIQDIGCRFYTYVSTMGLALEAAKEEGIHFVVLDRVNPIGGVVVDGPVRKEDGGNDFVAFHEIPVQHGMTVGELARMFNVERGIGANLTVIPLEGWVPTMRFDETGLPWVNPSPNMRSLTQAMLYPGVGLIEFANVSVGRGTSTPFEHVGSPWIHDGLLSQALREEHLDGIDFLPTIFTPDSSVYEGEDCAGVRFFITDRDRFRPLDIGIALMRNIQALYPETFDLETKGNILLRDAGTLDLVIKGASLEKIRESWESDLDSFLKRRAAFLIYPRN